MNTGGLSMSLQCPKNTGLPWGHTCECQLCLVRCEAEARAAQASMHGNAKEPSRMGWDDIRSLTPNSQPHFRRAFSVSGPVWVTCPGTSWWFLLSFILSSSFLSAVPSSFTLHLQQVFPSSLSACPMPRGSHLSHWWHCWWGCGHKEPSLWPDTSLLPGVL